MFILLLLSKLLPLYDKPLPFIMYLSPPVQGYVETGEKVHQITTQAPTFTVAWHPKKLLLAYACDDKVR